MIIPRILFKFTRTRETPNEPVELLVFYIIFNQNTLTGLFSFNNQKRLRFWTIFIFASLNVY